MLKKPYSTKHLMGRQLTLLCFAMLLCLLAPVRVLGQPLSAYVADCGEMSEQMDCCAMAKASPQPMSCCCQAPLTPGNMQTGATPSTTPKFIPIKSQGAITSSAILTLLSAFRGPDNSPAADNQPRTTKLPLYLRLRSLLI